MHFQQCPKGRDVTSIKLATLKWSDVITCTRFGNVGLSISALTHAKALLPLFKPGLGTLVRPTRAHRAVGAVTSRVSIPGLWKRVSFRPSHVTHFDRLRFAGFFVLRGPKESKLPEFQNTVRLPLRGVLVGTESTQPKEEARGS